MYYQFYELQQAALQPARAYADALRAAYSSPSNPIAATPLGRTIAASAEIFERLTRRYEKPAFGISSTIVDGKSVEIQEEVVWSKPFCRLIRFARQLPNGRKPDPRLLIVAPMSGHYATLIRGTVEAMLPHADVYVTDWSDARMVPLEQGGFDLDDYIDYVIEMLRMLGPGAGVMAVCQPSVPVLAAVSLMEKHGETDLPGAMVLMGGPIDPRRNPTAINRLAEERGTAWFRDHVVMPVPAPNPGCNRNVYPGFLQLTGFMGMNFDRHIAAHETFFRNLVKGDGDSAEKHRAFYDEFLAVMDLTAEFYLQTVDTVFVRHALAKGEMEHRGERIDPAAIRSVSLMTVEGENDDISGIGQTEAAHDLCPNIADSRRSRHLQPVVGHYGVFNGSRFRENIAPRIVEFLAAHSSAPEQTR